MNQPAYYLPQSQVPAVPGEPAPIPLDVATDAFGDDPEPRFLDYWRVVKRGWRWIAGAMAVCALVAGGWVLLKTPRYTADATILIERQAPQVLDVRKLVADGLSGDESNYYRTQREILESRSLAADVIRHLDLENHPAFAAQASEGLISGLVSQTRSTLKAMLGMTPPPAVMDDGGIPATLIDAYLGDLGIDPVTRTRLAKIRFTSEDPTLAAAIVEAHVEAYVRQGLRLRSEAGEDARVFLEGKLLELKARLEDSELALNRYRKEKGMVSLDDKENIVVDRLSDLNGRVSAAEANRIGLEAEVKLVQSRDYGSLPAVAGSALIQALKSQISEVERNYVELSARFKPAYPAVQEAKAEVDGMRKRLDAEIKKVVGAIESQYLAAVENEKQLRLKMAEQKQRALQLKDAAVQYAILKRETDSNRELYDSVLQRMKEIGVAAAVRSSNVSVIDQAVPPRFPSEPKKTQAVLLALFGGMLMGVGLVLGRHYIDSSIKSTEEVERYLRLPNLGVVPDFLVLPDKSSPYAPNQKPVVAAKDLAVADKGQIDQSLILARDPHSVVTESYRTLRTALLFSRPEAAPKTMLFTSALESEGKTTSTLNTALVFAKMGARVLVIDADLRRANCHKKFGLGNLFGLTEVLTGQRTFEDATRETAVDNVFLMSAGSLPPNPTELLGSRAMSQVIATAEERFDYVFVDTPPVMPVNDAVVMSPLVDGVVMVVGAHRTPRQILQRAEARLGQARAEILGVILNKLDASSDNYSTYYGGKYYSSYYHQDEQVA